MNNKFLKTLVKFSLIFMCILPFFKIEEVYASTTFTTCTLTENSYLRATPGGTPLKDVDDGSVLITNLNQKLEVVENGNGYKKVKANYYSNNYIGWVSNSYLKNCKSYTTDDNYANQLRSKGFPESYIFPLAKLHAMYPNWNFEVSKLGSGLNFNDAVNGEYSPVYKNLMGTTNLNAIKPLLSTDGSAYNAGVYKQFEPGWYAPSKQTIAFYMDPRNWLNDNTIFMFEKLSYNPSVHTASAVQNRLNGTFMSGSYTYNGQTWSFANTFVEAGKQKNVNPIQIVSRVIQEQSTKGSSTVNMDGGDGKRYYNYFNINAYGSTTQQIVANALATAKKNGWTSPYTSIIGGSEIISNNYTGVGQDTIYYQKFNTIYSNSLYSHQYMANVRVLPSEANSMYKAYDNSGVINNSFTFKIPVYSNMPDATTLSTKDNADNTLKSLSVTGCNLNPSFNSAATNYTCNVPSSTNQVTVSAVKSSAYSSMKGDGVSILNNNSTVINIVVTAANGESRTYKITVNKIDPGKEPPSGIISSIGFNNSNNIISGIALGTDISNVITNIKNKYSLAIVSVKNKSDSIKNSGAIATGDKITITNNNQTTTFIVSVKGDVNGDGKISISDYAKVKSHILGISKVSNEYLKAADANGDGKISISDYAKIKSHILGISKITN